MENDTETEKPKIKLGCNLIISIFSLIFILIIVSIGFIIFSKPKEIWSPIITILNNGVVLDSNINEELKNINIKEFISKQIKSLGDNTIIIPEKYLSPLIKEQIEVLPKLRVDLEKDKINVYWVLEESIKDNPLIAHLQLRIGENDEVILSKLGVPLVSLPEVINKLLLASTLNTLKVAGDNLNFSSVLTQLLDINQNAKINGIKILDNQVEINVNISINLF